MVADEEMTKDEAKLYKMLSDGMWHSREELHTCLWDHEQSQFPIAMQVRLSMLRKRIRPHGLDAVSRRTDEGRWGYILVRKINHRE
jgi:DNA-binding response OmpR family regulator